MIIATQQVRERCKVVSHTKNLESKKLPCGQDSVIKDSKKYTVFC